MSSLAALDARAIPTINVRDVTLFAGQSFQMPLDGGGADPITFAVVSISNSNVTGTITSGNPSLVLNVTGTNGQTNSFSGDLVFELFADLAPVTTARIISLVTSNFYDGLTFHRVVNDFVAQGGDPLGNGTGGTGITFSDEYATNLTFTGFGQLAMVNSGDDSNDSQFFVTDGDLTLAPGGPAPPRHLNFDHTIFGQLTSGFAVLDQIIETPVSNSVPVSPLTITNASIITNRTDAVLRLTAATNFTGTATVTVGATDVVNLSTQATFTVTVIADTVNDKPFMNPQPNSLVVTQNVAAFLPLTGEDLENDQLTLLVGTTNNPGVFPEHLDAFYDSANGQLVLLPEIGFTGTFPLVVGVRDQVDHDGDMTANNIEEFDTEKVTLTVVSGGGSSNLTLVVTKGKILNSVFPGADKVKLAATLAFNTNAIDSTFNVATDIFLFEVGGSTNAVTLSLNPGDAGWKVKKGKFTWKSAGGSPVKASLSIDTIKGTLKFSAAGIELEEQENPIRVRLVFGDNSGVDEKNWTPQKPGVLTFP